MSAEGLEEAAKDADIAAFFKSGKSVRGESVFGRLWEKICRCGHLNARLTKRGPGSWEMDVFTCMHHRAQIEP